MWILKRVTKGLCGTDRTPHHLLVGEYLVGRKDCQIQVSDDQSVSRKHAYITVSDKGTSDTRPSHITVRDVSKFGTFINGVKCQGSVELKHGDTITFGTQNSSYRLSYKPLVIFASCLDNAKKKMLKAQINKLGGYMVSEWQKECTHLVMDALSFTVKVIYALVTCCPVVKPSYFCDLFEGITSKSTLPLTENFMPPIKEDLIDPQVVSFQPDEARKSLLAGKLFLFLEKKQHKRLHQIIKLAGGTSLLKECGNIPEDDDLLIDENTLVISVDLKSEVPVENQMWIGHVGDILASCNRRPIPETEVGLAILHLSINEYCNFSRDHIPLITKHIVSKSLEIMEGFSQRVNESQNASVVPVPDKKPFIRRTNVDQAKTIDRKTSVQVTPQKTNKRSRTSSSDAPPLALDTPLIMNSYAETKRRKLSSPVSEVSHISQTQHSPVDQKTADIILAKNSLDDVQSKLVIPKSEVTHISQSEQSLMTVNVKDTPGDNRGEAKKLDQPSPKSEVTHISQSQHSVIDMKVGDTFTYSPGGKKCPKLGSCKLEVTTASQDLPPYAEVYVSDTRSPESSLDSKRRRLSVSKSYVTHISQSQLSQAEIQASHSPTKTSVDSEHRASSMSLHAVTSRRSFKQENPSPPDSRDLTKSRITFSSFNDSCSKKSNVQQRCDAKHSAKAELDNLYIEQFPNERDIVNSKVLKSDLVDGYPARPKRPGEDSSDKNPTKIAPDSGWISKKSLRDQDEGSKVRRKYEIDSSGEPSRKQTENFDRVTVELSSNEEQGLLSQKLPTPGFLSKEGGRQEQRKAVVKEEDDLELPTNVLCIEHVELIVARNSSRKKHAQEKNSAKLKNMKRFRKQNVAGSGSGLPRIIGGSDLIVFSSRSKDVEDWFIEIQEMNRERDLEDQLADDLFRYEPKNRRGSRR